eukprot:5717486-Amphidinium_carterae.1
MCKSFADMKNRFQTTLPFSSAVEILIGFVSLFVNRDSAWLVRTSSACSGRYSREEQLPDAIPSNVSYAGQRPSRIGSFEVSPLARRQAICTISFKKHYITK